MAKYYIFLSCEDGIKIGDESIEQFLNENSHIGNTFERVKKCNAIKTAQDDLDDYEKNCIYVVDTHTKFDNITYWELGYAMGKGIKIIGYYDGKNKMEIPHEIQEVIRVPKSINIFLNKINTALSKIEPEKGPIADDWNKQIEISKRELEAT